MYFPKKKQIVLGNTCICSYKEKTKEMKGEKQMQKEKLSRKNKGITLIALIITIIVMLILVGVTVSVSINGGLFSKAKEAGNKTEMAAEKDILTSLVLGALDNNGKVNFADLKTAVDKNKTFEEVSVDETMGVYASKKFGNKYTVPSSFPYLPSATREWICSGKTA